MAIKEKANIAELLKVNRRLEVLVDSDQKMQERYTSRIEGITDAQLHIAMPMRKSIPVILFKGAKFTGRIVANNSAWHFISTFIDKKFQPLPIWIISKPSDLIKVQMRSYVRIPANLAVTLSILNEERQLEPVKAVTRDISGGGAQIIAKKLLPEGTKLLMGLILPDVGLINAEGIVVRVDRSQDPDIYWIAIRFTEILERDRDNIIKFVFKTQIDRHQKGL